ncbi:MAG: type II methionyl aminopeptidase [Desulfobacteraceae bacterium]|nr:type II methionyl aminopeptidase [Candidatus Bathyarchaeota archaeon]MCK4782213.1 type II methionyl aminopeptidase [Desulfobacteraceae bacterium]
MSLPQDILKKYEQAGKIAREVRMEMKGLVQEGTPVIQICEKAEELVRKKGGLPAFPCNVSINEIAAHYTSPPNDTRVIPPKSVVKVDVGVHIDGYIADTAITLSFNPSYNHLLRTAERALKLAVESIYAGISTSKLGSLIEDSITRNGCRPVSNLTGHQVGRYMIHTGKSIPNVSHLIGSKIKEGEVIAIEPFVTEKSAKGKVKDGVEATIFRLVKRKTLKDSNAQQLFSHIDLNYRTMPFSERWMADVVPQQHYSTAFQELRSRCLMSYYTFVEVSGRPVAQAEHTVLVTKDGCMVLT